MKCFFPVSQAFVFLSFVAFVCICATCRADDPSKGMAAKLAEICRKRNVPAMAVAVVNANGLVQSQCFGNRKRETSGKVELSDRFPIGSNTKSMTATLAAVLVEAGKIDWETTIGDVWPIANDVDIHPQLRKITLDQLLSHQSGLAENISDISGQAWAKFFEEKQSPTLERRGMLKIVLSPAPTHPQGKYAYSNLGYAVVSAMLETRAKESFESLMKKHVFDPLEMRSADFRSMKSAQQLKSPLLWGHQADGGKSVDPRTVGAENPTVYAAAGTVHLSIVDYAKYARWQLAGKPTPVLRSQSAYDHLHEPLVDKAPSEKYGCGWICLDSGVGPALTHAGSNTNAFSVIWVFPKSDFAVVVCTNSGEPQAFPACDEMISHLMMELAVNKAVVVATPSLGQNRDAESVDKPSTQKETKKMSEPENFLSKCVGKWQGTVKTWFEPGKLADESKVSGEIVSLMNRKFFRHTYEGSMKGKPRHGEETLAMNSITKKFQVCWFDDFHMNTAILISEGDAIEHGLSLIHI